MSKFPDSKPSRSQARAAASPLKRGAACLNCRHFKIKCDGKRPHCTPCLTHPKEDDCEYQDGPRSRTKALEDKIAALEAHIFELENPDQTPPMQLSNPYSQTKSALELVIPGPGESPLSPGSPGIYSPSHDSASSTTSRPSPRDFLAQLNSPSSAVIEEEPSSATIQQLMDLFMPHCSEVGLFLNPSHFLASVVQVAPIGNHSRPCPSLLYASYLWGNHFRNFYDVAQQRIFESRALRHCATDLCSSSHPDRIIHCLQANVLLAYYYLHSARIQEAGQFVTSAISLVLSSGLHTTSSTLPSPRDSVEAGERIDAFWTVFTLSRFAASLSRASSPAFCNLLEVLGCDADVPWPLDVSAYEQGTLPEVRKAAPVSFVQGVDTPQVGGHAILAVEAKASILLNEASSLMSRWQSEDFASSDSFSASYKRLSDILSNLRSALPRLGQFDSSHPYASRLYVALSTIEASSVILYQAFADTDSSYRTACLKSATSIIMPGNLDVKQFAQLNPIIGFVWTTAISALNREIKRLQYASPMGGQLSAVQLQECINKGIAFLRQYSTNSPILRESLAEVLPKRDTPLTSSSPASTASFPTTPIELSQHVALRNPSPDYSYGYNPHHQQTWASVPPQTPHNPYHRICT